MQPGDVVRSTRSGAAMVVEGHWGLRITPQTKARHRTELRLAPEHVAGLGLSPTAWLIRCEELVQVHPGQHLGTLPRSVMAEVQRTAHHAQVAHAMDAPQWPRSLRVPRASRV